MVILHVMNIVKTNWQTKLKRKDKYMVKVKQPIEEFWQSNKKPNCLGIKRKVKGNFDYSGEFRDEKLKRRKK